MFERFTDRARRVVVLAQEEARRLQHNYIGTEHILLGLIHETEGFAARALRQFGMSLDETRDEVTAIVGLGQVAPPGHIPFTPRAKKTLELALREALAIGHNYIGTEHVLLGLIHEGDGVAAQIMRQHADLLTIRLTVLDLVNATPVLAGRRRAWLRRRLAGEPLHEEPGNPGSAEQTELSASPAVDATLSEAARLAGGQPVSSHHLLLAVISDSSSAAAHALTALGVDLDQARTALSEVDIAGTSDEPPEEAGRRGMTIRVDGDRVVLTAEDPVLLSTARETLREIGGDSAISGDTAVAASFSSVWQALRDGLESVQRAARAGAPKQAATPKEQATDQGEAAR